MGIFFLITGNGKTGTTWLGEALNHPRHGIICLDEGKVFKPSHVKRFLRRFTTVQHFHSHFPKINRCIQLTLLYQFLPEIAKIDSS